MSLRAFLHLTSVYLLLALSAAPRPARAQERTWSLSPEATGWTLEHFTTADGLAQNSVNDLVQTRDGYLWIATFGGLARFDGVRFVVFDRGSTPSLPGLRVTALLETAAGELWAGFQEGSLCVLRNGVFQEILPAGSAGIVWDMDEDARGQLWLATDMGIGAVQEGGSLRWAVQWEPQHAATDLVATSDTLWALEGASRTLLTLNLAGEVLSRVKVGPEWGELRGPEPGPGGSILLSTDRGMARAFPWGLELLSPSTLPASSETMDEAARWALGARVRLPGGQPGTAVDEWLSTPLRHPLPAPVRTGLADSEGGLWVGTLGLGLLHLRRSPLRRVAGLEDPQALAEDAEGNIWVAACGEELARITPELQLRSLPNPGVPYRCFRDVAVAGDGAVWFGNSEGRIRRVRGNQVDLVNLPRVRPARESFAPSPDRVRIWQGGAPFTWEGTGWTPGGRPLLPEGTEFSSLLALGESEYLLGTFEGGLYHASPRGVDTLIPDGAEPPAAIRGMVRDDRGDVWIGTYGTGILHWSEGDLVRTLGTSDGLGENVAIGLALDRVGNLWVSGNLLLSRIPLEDLRGYLDGRVDRLRPAIYGSADGFMEGNGVGALHASDGRLWFPGIDGVTVVDPARLAVGGALPPVILERVRADGRPLSLDELAFSSDTREVELEYTLPTFTRPENIRFRYRLVGLNQEWTEADSRRSAFFSRLPPGRYTFEVEAVSLESGERSLATLPLRVAPTLMQTVWFRGLSATTLLGILLLLISGRVKSLQRRAGELERHARALQREIDERTRLEEEKDALTAQLSHAQKMEAVGRLTGGIAHDFNNLLTTIMGHLDLLEMKAGPAVTHHVSAALEASTRAGSLTRELLAFSRRSPLEPKESDLTSLLDRMRPLLGPALTEGIRLQVSSDPALWTCRVDPNRLENVILNLCINARDAMPQGGEIRLSLGNGTLAGGEAARRDLPEGEYVRLEVSDTGTGIPADILGQVMDPFFTTKPAGKGTGLGLSMAYGFAKQSGGHLEIESAEGEGTTVRLFLPRGGGTPSAEEPLSVPIPQGAGERILVVEDDEALRAITVEYLRILGYRPLSAPSVRKARDLLVRQHDIGLVLADIILPEESGLTLARDLALWRPQLPVVLVSGTGEMATGDEGGKPIEGWGGPFLAKPFTRRSLGEAVHKALTGPGEASNPKDAHGGSPGE